jgi:hypothetical protein
MTASDDGDEERVPDATPPREGADPPMAASWNRADLQRIWLGTQRRTWRTLAIVPVGEGTSSYHLAWLITTLGIHNGESVCLADVRDIHLDRARAILESASELANRGNRVIFATRSITENLATIPVARAAEGVILCVSMGSTLLDRVQETIDQIGKERLLGSMLIHDAGTTGVAVSPVRPPPRRLQARS